MNLKFTHTFYSYLFFVNIKYGFSSWIDKIKQLVRTSYNSGGVVVAFGPLMFKLIVGFYEHRRDPSITPW